MSARPRSRLRRPAVGCAGLLLLFALAAGCAEGAGGAGPPCPVHEGVVSRVIDGDTLEVSVICREDADCPNEQEDPGHCLEDGRCDRDSTVRLVGVNAGEIPHGLPDDPPAECLGQTAREELTALVAGQTVRLVYEPVAGCRDQYGRLLAYVFLGDEMLQTRLLGQGLVCIYWASSSPERELTRYYDVLTAAENTAYDAETGIWSPSDDVCGGLRRYTGTSRCAR